MQRLRCAPATFNLVIVDHIFSNALQKVALNQAAGRLFAEVRLNLVIAFSSEAAKRGKRLKILRTIESTREPLVSELADRKQELRQLLAGNYP